MKKFLIFICIAFLIFFTGFFVWRLYYNKELSVSKKDVIKNNIFVKKESFSEIGDKGFYKITAHYPVVYGLENKKIEDVINKDIKTIIFKKIDSFKNDIDENINNFEENDPSSFDIDFKNSKCVSDNIVCFVLGANFYRSGSAHSGEEIDAYIYSLSDGKKVYLGDVFSGEYLSALSKQSKILLIKKLGNNFVEQINQGADSVSENFSVFVPEKDGFHIIFNQYQVAPYAEGIQEIVIPYSYLKNFIKTNSIIFGFI